MKFSVLLPTHNRLDLLRYAVESVLRQDYADWELVISDNASQEDVAGYVTSLNEPRIRYFRTETFLSVTENWNRCLDQAVGDYLIMLGDDDALMPAFFSTLSPLVDRYQSPNVIYSDAYIFAYPGVLKAYPQGYLRKECNPFFKSKEPFLLSEESRLQLVRAWLGFRNPANFNMQFSVVKTAFARSLKSQPFFQSLFPDYYATIVCFLMASHILVYQQPLVIIGLSKKSHGYLFYNNQIEAAKQALHAHTLKHEIEEIPPQLLSNDWMMMGWASAAHTVAKNYATELAQEALSVNYAEYQQRVMKNAFAGYFRDRLISTAEYREFMSSLSLREQLAYTIKFAPYYIVSGLLSPQDRARIVGMVSGWLGKAYTRENLEVNTGATTILDVFNREARHLKG